MYTFIRRFKRGKLKCTTKEYRQLYYKLDKEEKDIKLRRKGIEQTKNQAYVYQLKYKDEKYLFRNQKEMIDITGLTLGYIRKILRKKNNYRYNRPEKEIIMNIEIVRMPKLKYYDKLYNGDRQD